MEATIYHVSAEDTATGPYVRVIMEVKYQRYLEAPLLANGQARLSSAAYRA